jgi:hypothetical protein
MTAIELTNHDSPRCKFREEPTRDEPLLLEAFDFAIAVARDALRLSNDPLYTDGHEPGEIVYLLEQAYEEAASDPAMEIDPSTVEGERIQAMLTTGLLFSLGAVRLIDHQFPRPEGTEAKLHAVIWRLNSIADDLEP